jgi:hypothetical protein
MNKAVCIAFLAATLSTAALADCTYPRAPDKMPDGTAAAQKDAALKTSEERKAKGEGYKQLLGAVKSVKQYQAEVDAYVTCLQSQNDATIAATPDLTEERKQQLAAMLAKRLDSAQDAKTEIVDNLNVQVKAYNAVFKKAAE